MEESTEPAPPTYASVGSLTADLELETRDVALANGTYVQVRGMTRAELMAMGKDTEDGMLMEARNLVNCVVKPKLSLAQAQQWQKSSLPKDIGKVTEAIRELSGLSEGAPKSDVDSPGG